MYRDQRATPTTTSVSLAAAVIPLARNLDLVGMSRLYDPVVNRVGALTGEGQRA